MAITFRIPKLTDREIIRALDRIRNALAPKIKLGILIHPTHLGAVKLPEKDIETFVQIKFILDAESQVVSTFQLIAPNGNEAFAIYRETEKITDKATLSDVWTNNADQSLRERLPELHVALLSTARAELKANDLDASFKGTDDDSWNRYRDAQTAVINSLQQATETLIIKASEQNAELDKKRSERFEKLETELRGQLENERQQQQKEYNVKQATVGQREQVLKEKEAAFNTKESHYVARQKQTEQLEKIQSWLDNWSLTKGTTNKRRSITTAYIVALVVTGGLTAYATWHSYDILKSIDDVVKLAWWQWAGIWAKCIFPLAAFVTFIIYFIRWSGDWARQHSEEEFRNRTRLVDIGRSSWLLEAVRDAQERNKEIPPDLLRELSRNLFATSAAQDKDIYPQAVSDVMLQGLSSLRIKSPDGAEVEATRNGRK